ncbi:tripartite tricarboxylate transporter permease [Virgibacillus oceani]
MIDAAIEALGNVIQPVNLTFMLLGITIGLIIGILPGLGGTVGMALVIPFLYGMDPYAGVALMIGLLAVTQTSDTFPSVLFGIPGTAASQATIMDGYPLAKQGHARRALSAAFISSMFGGIIGGITLFLTIPIIRPLILSFGSPELFMLTLFGITIIGMVAGRKPIQGILMGIVGLLVGTIGAAPAAPEYRFTFDWLYLYDGISIIILVLAFFAIPEMVELLSSKRKISNTGKLEGSSFQGIRDVFNNKWLVIRSSSIGAFIGAIPGLGGSIIDWIAYFLAKKTVKNSEGFGKGDIRGVIAPESATNSKEGGQLISTLLFSIPGSTSMAVLLGGLILMGIETGPSMVSDNLPITMSIIWTLIIANIFATGVSFFIAKPVSLLTTIDPNKFVPFLLVIISVGAYQATRSWVDLLLLLAFGFIGWIMKEINWSRIPFIIGVVLAVPSERYFFISIERYGLDWLTRPVVIIIGIIIILTIIGSPLVSYIKNQRNKRVKI